MDKQALIMSLKRMINEHGRNAFNDVRRIKALLTDYCPMINGGERNLLYTACESGVFKIIVQSDGQESDMTIYQKAKSILVNDYMISEHGAYEAIDWMFQACGKKLPDVTVATNDTDNRYNEDIKSFEAPIDFNCFGLWQQNITNNELLSQEPVVLQYITTPYMTYVSGAIFSLMTMAGMITYITKVCLEYCGKQYIVAQMPPMNMNYVFRLENGMLFPEMNPSIGNMLVNFCGNRGWLC